MAHVSHETYRELAQLRAKVDELQRENAMLRAPNETKAARLAAHFGISRGPAELLVMLASGDIITRERALDVHGHEGAGMEAIPTRVKRLRKAIPWIRIKAIYGFGYQCDPVSAARLRKILEGAR